MKCKKRYTTYEKIDKGEIWVIKKDGTRQIFQIDKIKVGVERAFEKRPVSKEEIKKTLDEIEEQIRKKGKREIRSSIIGELVMKKIKKLDNIAYIRFASVYKEFKDVQDFKKEIKDL